MKKNDRDFLLTSLSAMLPYKVLVAYTSDDYPHQLKGVWRDAVRIDGYRGATESPYYNGDPSNRVEKWCGVESVKPYLVPMSSMTAEERHDIVEKYGSVAYNPKKGIVEVSMCSVSRWIEFLNYMLSRHYDINGLIEKDLAIEAPSGMYDIKAYD